MPRSVVPHACGVALALSACTAPPEAPSGLNESTAYMVRNFYADDATFQAGVQGFVEWFETEGQEILDVAADLESTDAFSVASLTDEDLAHLPLDAEVITEPGTPVEGETDLPSDAVLTPRDPARATGVVSLANMDCTWKDAEALLVRPDQDSVFSGDWEGYERTYATPRETYEGATAAEVYQPIHTSLDPFTEDFDPTDYAETLLLTDNLVDPTRVITSNIEAYQMPLHLRHGTFELNGEEFGGFVVLTFIPQAAWGTSGQAALLQSYSIELNLERPGDQTLRMLAVWAEPFDRSGLVPPDSAAAKVYAVNKSLDSSAMMSQICAGEIEID